MKKTSYIYSFLIYALLYFPIVVMIIFSFNASASTGIMTGVSFKWYKVLFQNEDAISALYNTLILAVSASIISTILGTSAAVGIDKIKKNWLKASIMSTTNIPMLNPDIVTGFSMMLLFVFAAHLLNIKNVLGFGTLLIAHITFCLPYVILSVLPKLRQVDPHLSEAAQDLGCHPFISFFKVVLPSIMPGILSGLLMAFTLSIDDFLISYFVTDKFQTLPIYINSMTKKRVTPDMYALSSLIFLAVLIVLILSNIIQSRGDKKFKIITIKRKEM